MSETHESQNNLPSVSLFRRLMAILYDGLLLLALYFIAGWIAVLINGEPIEHGSVASWLLFAVMLVISFIYFGWFWIHGGQTLGMKTWRMRLQKDGDMNWPAAAVYFASALLSWSMAGTGFLLALLHPQNKTLHDILNHSRMLDLR